MLHSRTAMPVSSYQPCALHTNMMASNLRAIATSRVASAASSAPAACPLHSRALPLLPMRQGLKLQPQPPPQQQQRRPVPVVAAAAAGAAAMPPAHRKMSAAEAAAHQFSRFRALAGKFMPMVGLFFTLAFINTILDSLKDTLVITAAGGGAQVIPYLTVYAVLPCSLVFLYAYSHASQYMSRPALFNAIVGVFMAFFAVFAFVLYPNHDAIHPHGMADKLLKMVPDGLEGLVGMLRNWTFTLFFCMSELWGDVCLGLLFWGLANDTTSMEDAPTLYPLFGIGANVAQALAGTVLKIFSGDGSRGFGSEIQSMMIVVMAFSVAALVVHAYINKRVAAQRAQAGTEEQRAAAAAVAAAAAAAEAAKSEEEKEQEREKNKPSVKEVFRVLASSTPIRCLAVMSLAQGLCTSLMEFAWKSHIKLLYPTPSAFTSFLGDVSMWQGVVTGCLMLVSPAMFDKMGWAGVAAATPRILLAGGAVFFVACLAYQYAFAAHAAAAASGVLTAGPAQGILKFLVFGGALLYVFSKSAKFSLFKPAEEMVYISLDEEGRTKGKAAIDVVGAQAGKSSGSILQQVLLFASGGGVRGSLPVMFGVFVLMAQGWLKSVATLAGHKDYGSVHGSMDGDEVFREQQEAFALATGAEAAASAASGAQGSGQAGGACCASNGSGAVAGQGAAGAGNGKVHVASGVAAAAEDASSGGAEGLTLATATSSSQ